MVTFSKPRQCCQMTSGYKGHFGAGRPTFLLLFPKQLSETKSTFRNEKVLFETTFRNEKVVGKVTFYHLKSRIIAWRKTLMVCCTLLNIRGLVTKFSAWLWCTIYNFVFKRINIEKLFKPRNYNLTKCFTSNFKKIWHRFCSNQKSMGKSHTFFMFYYNYIKQYIEVVSTE